MRVLSQQIRLIVVVASLIWSLHAAQHAMGQNLIPNPGFETTGNVPCGWTTSASSFSNAIADWKMPSNGTPDVHATFVGGNCWNAQPASNYAGWDCWRGGQTPRTGQAMVGLFTVANVGSWREYIQVKFISPMIPGQAYDVGFYVCLANSSSLATNNLGIHLTTAPVSGAWGNMPLTPQIVETNIITDTSHWAWVGGTIIASSAFEYLTIGNFSTNANTSMLARAQPCDGAYYFIDDACVSLSVGSTCARILDAQVLNFTVAANSDHTVSCDWEIEESEGISHFSLQRSSDGITFDGIANVNIRQPSKIYAYKDLTPRSGKSYYRLLQADHNGQQYFSQVQEVQVHPGPRLRIHPNPATDHAPQLTFDQVDSKELALRIFDARGRTYYTGTHQLQQGQLKLSLENLVVLAPGMYIVSYKTPSTAKCASFFVN